MTDSFDYMTAETKLRWQKQQKYIALAEELGDSIQFDGTKATIYIRAVVDKKESK